MRKRTLLANTIVGTTLVSLASGISTAQAASFIPQKEGEIKLTNIGCIADTCIDTTSMGYTITSLAYDFDSYKPQMGLSRLFVDKRATDNDWGFGIKFKQQDAGTNNPDFEEYWLRPVAYRGKNADSAPTVSSRPAENGQLEIGRFQFDFAQTVSELLIEFFDVEDDQRTGILAVNGTPITQLLDAGPDGNFQTLTVKNVNSLVLQLGNPGPNSTFKSTGDGVSLAQVTSVPEPGVNASLGVLAMFGIFGLGQRKKVAKLG
jgi:hypothetical protein